MDTPVGVITVASLFTAAGAGAAALVIRQIVELLKAVLPGLDARVSGALQSFALSLLLYIFAAVALPVGDANGILLVVVSWLTCAVAAVGIDQAWTRARSGGL